MNAPQFNVEPGCKIGKAKFFCVPATKTFVSANDKATKPPTPIGAPLPVYAPDSTVDRICYKAKCPEPVVPPDSNVTDQFGNRTLTKFKTKMICTPAVKGAAYCGDGIINGTEACDGLALGACTIGCQPDCTCTCETACCYVENLAVPPDAECFEYSGTPAQVLAFQTACTNGVPPPAPGVPGSMPLGSMANSNVGAGFITAPCGAFPSPLFLTPCVLGPPGFGNLHVIPADSSCP